MTAPDIVSSLAEHQRSAVGSPGGPMRRTIALSLFTLVALTPTVRSQAPASKPTQGDPAEEVRQMQKRYADAIQQSDTAALGKIWADDYTFTNGTGQLVTKAQRLANLRTGAT